MSSVASLLVNVYVFTEVINKLQRIGLIVTYYEIMESNGTPLLTV